VKDKPLSKNDPLESSKPQVRGIDESTDGPVAYATYQMFADAYSSKIDTKPHNAYYDRPAILSLLPNLEGLNVLDAGCGPGVYSEGFVKRGANVTAIDFSERMIELARQRLGDSVDFHLADLGQPLTMLADEQFSVVVAPLCLDYVQDWRQVFSEFYRTLKPGGCFVKSSGHPSFDAEYFNTSDYFSVEPVECTWTGFGEVVQMPSFRRSLEEFFMPLLDVGFHLDRVLEPLPTEEFRKADPVRYQRLLHRPGFLCLRATKPMVCKGKCEQVICA